MKKVSLPNLFLVFSKIGAFTIGGGYAMIPIIEQEMAKRGWIPEEEIPEIIVLAQSAPGLLAVNMSIYAGYRIRGVKGSIAATLGAIMPSFVIILLIAAVFTTIRDNPYYIKIFKAVRPVAIALILVPLFRMAGKNSSWWEWTLTVGTALGVSVLSVSPIVIIASVLVAASCIGLVREGRKR